VPEKKQKTKYDRFANLYQKFKAGGKWLDARIAAGQDVQKDTVDFSGNVIIPLHQLWEEFNAQERAAMERVMAAHDQFGGRKIEFTPAPVQQKLAV
jgi:hypothetical protein